MDLPVEEGQPGFKIIEPITDVEQWVYKEVIYVQKGDVIDLGLEKDFSKMLNFEELKSKETNSKSSESEAKLKKTK